MVLDNNTIVGSSPAFDSLLPCTRLIAATDITVLIHGEPGSGKERLAKYIHQSSRRSDQPFVRLNCAALPKFYLESELFGQCKKEGYDNPGRIASAEGGTLYIDRIDALSLSAQIKFLHLLETDEITPIGATQPRQVNIRIIAATHRDLAQLVESGDFNTELFYRLFVVPLEMPPLSKLAINPTHTSPVNTHWTHSSNALLPHGKLPHWQPQQLPLHL